MKLHMQTPHESRMCLEKLSPRGVFVPLGQPWSSFCPVCLSVCLSVVNFNLRYNFWTIRGRDFIFGMHTPLMIPFQMTPRSMTLWPWLLTFVLKIAFLDFVATGGIVSVFTNTPWFFPVHLHCICDCVSLFPTNIHHNLSDIRHRAFIFHMFYLWLDISIRSKSFDFVPVKMISYLQKTCYVHI